MLVVNGAVFFQERGHAQESSADPGTLVIIQLIEDRLAGAFNLRSKTDAPDFGTLDRIYPQWHYGEPAKARRDWTFHPYNSYAVSYMVYSVILDRPGMATVRGRKRVAFSREKKLLKYFTKVKHETSETQFTIICHRNLSGDWEIMKETVCLIEDQGKTELDLSPLQDLGRFLYGLLGPSGSARPGNGEGEEEGPQIPYRGGT
jgi:hypothetical protein